MIVGVLATCHTQYTWERSVCNFLFNRTTLQVFVTYLIDPLYMHPLWFYKHQHDNRLRSKLFVACQRRWFQWRFWFVPSVPGYLREVEGHKPDLWRNPIHILLSQVYCVWQVVITAKSFRVTLYRTSVRWIKMPSIRSLLFAYFVFSTQGAGEVCKDGTGHCSIGVSSLCRCLRCSLRVVATSDSRHTRTFS